jgi:hypothetical protein
MKRFVLTLTFVAALALLTAPAASAIIQINRGIAGARLGNSKPEVRSALGRPNRILNGTNDFGPFTEFRYRGGIRVTFQGRTQVTGVSTTGLGDRTRRGVGVGSRGRAVRRRVPGVSCQLIPGGRLCQTGNGLPGQRITAFLIRNGRVRRVTVAIVID